MNAFVTRRLGLFVHAGVLLGVLTLAGWAQPTVPAANSGVVLTNIAQLRALTLDEARRQLPVRLRAVVDTIGDETATTIFIGDETGGTFMVLAKGDRSYEHGMLIEVTGRSYAEFFVPGIRAESVRVVGRGELPPPVPAGFDDLLYGRLHYQRVVVEGVIRTVRVETNRLTLQVALGPRKLEVRLPGPQAGEALPMVDSWVRATGVVVGTYLYGQRRQLVAPRLDVRLATDLEIKRPAVPDPFAMPTLAVSQLLNFDPGGISVHQVKVRGVVTHQQAGRALFLRDGDRGLYVQTRQAEMARPGDVVEVVGFPAVGQFSLFLEDAMYRRVGSEAEPRPVVTNARRELRGTNDANLVSLEAQILDVLRLPAESVLLMSADEMTFNARLPAGPPGVRAGSRVRLTGICRIKDSENPGFETGSGSNQRSVEFLLRSPADLQVLAAPSWWTVPRLAGLIGVLLLVALAAFTWVVLLGRRVAGQTAVIRRKIEREAMLEERHRVAREIHDALAQSFSGLDFQLEALGTELPDSGHAREHLDTAKKMVRHGQEEFRRSLTNLRARELERGGLAEALTELGGQMTAGSGVAFEVKCSGKARGLNEAVENNLLRIGQECITNAIRHAKASRITAQVEFDAKSVKLSVTDDGAGFDAGKLEQLDPNHFGWRGIRERAEQIGAEVKLVSQPGRGTEVMIVVPS